MANYRLNGSQYHIYRDYYPLIIPKKRKSLIYKVNGVGLDFSIKHSKKKIKIKKNIRKILVIGAYKKDKGYLEVIKVAELLKNHKIQIECYGYGNYDKFNFLFAQVLGFWNEYRDRLKQN